MPGCLIDVLIINPRVLSGCLISLAISCVVSACGGGNSASIDEPASGSSAQFVLTFEITNAMNSEFLQNMNGYWLSEWGSLGFDIPESYHLDYYDLSSSSGARTGQRNLFENNYTLTLNAGSYEFFIYNNDFDYNTIQYSSNSSLLYASTNKDSQYEVPEAFKSEEIRFQPDPIFANFFSQTLSTRTSSATLNNSDKKYYLTISRTAPLITSLYLIMLSLENNKGRITDCKAAVTSGWAEQFELRNAQPCGKGISHGLTPHFLHDIVYARLHCFGPSPEADTQSISFWLTYAEGTKRIDIDLKEALAQIGNFDGALKCSVDVDSLDFNQDAPAAGGLGANVNGWEGEENHYLDI